MVDFAWDSFMLFTGDFNEFRISGVPWEPTEFLQKSMMVTHPMDRSGALPTELRFAILQMAQRDAGGRYVHLSSSWQIARNARNIILHFSWLTMVIESCNPQWLTILNPQRRSWVFCIYDTLLFTIDIH